MREENEQKTNLLFSDFRIRSLERGRSQETYSKEKKREVKRRCDRGEKDTVCSDVFSCSKTSAM